MSNNTSTMNNVQFSILLHFDRIGEVTTANSKNLGKPLYYYSIDPATHPVIREMFLAHGGYTGAPNASGLYMISTMWAYKGTHPLLEYKNYTNKEGREISGWFEDTKVTSYLEINPELKKDVQMSEYQQMLADQKLKLAGNAILLSRGEAVPTEPVTKKPAKKRATKKKDNDVGAF